MRLEHGGLTKVTIILNYGPMDFPLALSQALRLGEWWLRNMLVILEVIAVSLSINFLSHTVSSLLGGCNWKQCHKNLSRVPIFSLQVSHIFGRHLIALVLISSTWTLNKIWACMVQLKSGPSITLTLSFNPRHCMTHSHWWIFLILSYKTKSQEQKIFSKINHFRVISCKFVGNFLVLL